MSTEPIVVLAYAVIVGGDVYELETSAENAAQEARRTGGKVIELVDRSAVKGLMSVARRAERLLLEVAGAGFGDAAQADDLRAAIASVSGAQQGLRADL